ncbi:NUDIX domain-containing protein [Sulfobacillus harzensis]|uniref:NUDIX domain-containing protein n=1 Tax=Sulfobacillus harzensis TaxID=2729629 RepID=A0A7Y0L5B8_9FIRM|nr:NUDIX domain-containing protein [Sulfobacillus harzensis]NMP23603.1 NUDIX domain-containing protein [Sulfobacillus harzensis]
MKPPVAKGTIQCPDLSGRLGTYDAKEVRFRPAAYGLLVRNGQLLMARSRFTGLWDFPGGGVEPFELLPEGMAREFQEETGLNVAVGSLLHVADGFIAMFGHPFHSLRFYYRCQLTDTSSDQLVHDPGEVTELRWWPLDEAPVYAMHSSDRDALNHLQATLS